MSKTLDLTKELISKPSITPNDMGCQDLISQRLKTLGFEVEQINFGEVSNLWATIGEGNKMLVLFFYPKDDTPGCTIEAKDFSKLNSLSDKFLKLLSIILSSSKNFYIFK